MSFEASDVRGATTGAITPKIGCWIFRKINLSPELNGYRPVSILLVAPFSWSQATEKRTGVHHREVNEFIRQDCPVPNRRWGAPGRAKRVLIIELVISRCNL